MSDSTERRALPVVLPGEILVECCPTSNSPQIVKPSRITWDSKACAFMATCGREKCGGKTFQVSLTASEQEVVNRHIREREMVNNISFD